MRWSPLPIAIPEGSPEPRGCVAPSYYFPLKRRRCDRTSHPRPAGSRWLSRTRIARFDLSETRSWQTQRVFRIPANADAARCRIHRGGSAHGIHVVSFGHRAIWFQPLCGRAAASTWRLQPTRKTVCETLNFGTLSVTDAARLCRFRFLIGIFLQVLYRFFSMAISASSRSTRLSSAISPTFASVVAWKATPISVPSRHCTFE
jgi:hypothetical protein